MRIVEFSVHQECGKDPIIHSEILEGIRDWLNGQPHLPCAYITDLDIALAYRRCHGDREKTKYLIDLNFTLRTLFSLYGNRTVDKQLEVACHTWLITPLDTPTVMGHRAVYCHLLDPDIEKFVYSDVIRAFVMIMDLWQYEQGSLPGVAFVVDMARVTLGHVSRIDLPVAQQFFYFLQEAMFIELKELHFINSPNFIDNMLSMVKPFLKKELLEIIKIHPVGSNTIERYILKKDLPIETGGDNKSCHQLKDNIWNKIKENKSFFEEEGKKRVDESKRPGGTKKISTFFPSVEESFKKLEID